MEIISYFKLCLLTVTAARGRPSDAAMIGPLFLPNVVCRLKMII